METMITHCKCVSEREMHDNRPYQFALNKLEPFDAMKVLLEQVLYYFYLKNTTNGTYILDDLESSLRTYYSELPKDISSANGGLQEMYRAGIEGLESFFHPKYKDEKELPRYSDCCMIFSQPLMKEYQDREYVPTINQNFVDILYCLVNDKFADLQTVRDKGSKTVLPLYMPSVKTILNYDPNIASDENDRYEICINLEPHIFGEFNFEVANKNWCSLWNLLNRYTYPANTVDDFIGIVASFAIQHDNYVMNLSSKISTIVDVCYDLVTGSSFTHSNAGDVKRPVVDHEAFIQLIRSCLSNRQLQPLQDYELFGALLTLLGDDPNIVNYFVQPDAKSITGEEAYAFRTSMYADFIPDRVIVAMEAAMEDDIADTGDDTADEGNTSMGETDTGTVVDDTQLDQPAEQEKPEINPDKMLLELASPNETMTDYIYREMISRRITAILQNPPESARPNDLLMLKRWKSRWIYLTSIACLRDFLSRVSIRLSETIS